MRGGLFELEISYSSARQRSCDCGVGGNPMAADGTDRQPSGEVLGSIREVTSLINRLRVITTLISGALGLIYSWLLLSNLPFPDLVNGSSASAILQFALVFMYLSWVIGMNVDVNLQAQVYIADPNRGRPSKNVYLGSAMLFITALLLFALRQLSGWFAAALTAFSLVCFWLLVTTSQSAIGLANESRKLYQGMPDKFGEEQLAMVERYVCGNWIWIRQLVLLSILAVVDFVCWADWVPKAIAKSIHSWRPEYNESPVANLIPVSSLIAFIVIAEAWQWYMRVKTKILILALDELKQNYGIERKVINGRPGEKLDIHNNAAAIRYSLRVSDIIRALKDRLSSYVRH